MTNTDIDSCAITLVRSYIKDLSFEVLPHPLYLVQKLKGSSKLDCDFRCNFQALENNYYEAQMYTKVTSFIEEGQLFIVEIQYHGIFYADPTESKEKILRFLSVPGMQMLYPHLQLTVNTLLNNNGMFPPIVFPMFNFEQGYDNYLQQQETAPASNDANNASPPSDTAEQDSDDVAASEKIINIKKKSKSTASDSKLVDQTKISDESVTKKSKTTKKTKQND